MKKLFTICFLATALVSLFSCSDIKTGYNDEASGKLTITLSQNVPGTKAGSVSTDAWNYEEGINRLDYFLFEERTISNVSTKTLYKMETVNNPTFNQQGKFTKEFDKLPLVSYTVVVVANGNSDIASLTTYDAICSHAVSLSNCSRTASEGFIMYAAETGKMASQQPTAISMSLERFPARVRLNSLTNGIPTTAVYANNSAIQLKGVFLTSVNSTWTLGTINPSTGADVAPSTLINNSLNSASFAGASSLTNASQTGAFNAYSVARGATNTPTITAATNWDTYAFPTSVPTSGNPPRLVIWATVNGADYYYPVALPDGIERNKTYEINATILGTGSTDIYTPVIRGKILTEISVKPWVPGGSYDETI